MNGITSTSAHKTRPVGKTQNSVPWFWPVELLSAVTEEEFMPFRRGFDTVAEAVAGYRVDAEFGRRRTAFCSTHTMRFRDFTPATRRRRCRPLSTPPMPVIRPMIADYSKGQSPVETLMDAGPAVLRDRLAQCDTEKRITMTSTTTSPN